LNGWHGLSLEVKIAPWNLRINKFMESINGLWFMKGYFQVFWKMKFPGFVFPLNLSLGVGVRVGMYNIAFPKNYILKNTMTRNVFSEYI